MHDTIDWAVVRWGSILRTSLHTYNQSRVNIQRRVYYQTKRQRSVCSAFLFFFCASFEVETQRGMKRQMFRDEPSVSEMFTFCSLVLCVIRRIIEVTHLEVRVREWRDPLMLFCADYFTFLKKKIHFHSVFQWDSLCFKKEAGPSLALLFRAQSVTDSH